MSDIKPLFNLVTPDNIYEVLKFKKNEFSKRFYQLLATKKVASIRIKTSKLTDSQITEIVEHIKEVSRNIIILIENDFRLVARLKLDGVHLTNGQKLVKEAKSFLSKGQVIGAFCGLSKHSGLIASEAGANYI